MQLNYDQGCTETIVDTINNNGSLSQGEAYNVQWNDTSTINVILPASSIQYNGGNHANVDGGGIYLADDAVMNVDTSQNRSTYTLSYTVKYISPAGVYDMEPYRFYLSGGNISSTKDGKTVWGDALLDQFDDEDIKAQIIFAQEGKINLPVPYKCTLVSNESLYSASNKIESGMTNYGITITYVKEGTEDTENPVTQDKTYYWTADTSWHDAQGPNEADSNGTPILTSDSTLADIRYAIEHWDKATDSIPAGFTLPEIEGWEIIAGKVTVNAAYVSEHYVNVRLFVVNYKYQSYDSDVPGYHTYSWNDASGILEVDDEEAAIIANAPEVYTYITNPANIPMLPNALPGTTVQYQTGSAKVTKVEPLDGGNSLTFANNSAGNNGGGLYDDGYIQQAGSTDDLALNSIVSFDNNTAVNSGGAIYLAEERTLSLDEPAMTGNTITGEDLGSVEDNTATGGGAIYVANGAVLTLASSEADVAKRNVTMSDNNSGNRAGGAIYLASGATLNNPNANSLTLEDNQGSYGAGIYIARNATYLNGINDKPGEFIINRASDFVFDGNGNEYYTPDSSTTGTYIRSADGSYVADANRNVQHYRQVENYTVTAESPAPAGTYISTGAGSYALDPYAGANHYRPVNTTYVTIDGQLVVYDANNPAHRSLARTVVTTYALDPNGLYIRDPGDVLNYILDPNKAKTHYVKTVSYQTASYENGAYIAIPGGYALDENWNAVHYRFEDRTLKGGAIFNAGTLRFNGQAYAFNRKNYADDGAAIYTIGTLDNENLYPDTYDATLSGSDKRFSLLVTNQEGDSAIGVGGGTATLNDAKIYNNVGGGLSVEGTGVLTLDYGTEVGIDSHVTHYNNYDLFTNENQTVGVYVKGGTFYVRPAYCTALFAITGGELATKNSVKISGNSQAGVVSTGGLAILDDAKLENNGVGLTVSGVNTSVRAANTLISDSRTDEGYTGTGVIVASGDVEFRNVTLANDSATNVAQLVNNGGTVELNNTIAPLTTISGNTISNSAETNRVYNYYIFYNDGRGNKYTLSSASPVINSGQNYLVKWFNRSGGDGVDIDYDLVGTTRILGTAVALGAYEYNDPGEEPDPEEYEFIIKAYDGYGWLDDVKFATEWVGTNYVGNAVRFDISCNDATFIWYNWTPEGESVPNSQNPKYAEAQKVENRPYVHNLVTDVYGYAGDYLTSIMVGVQMDMVVIDGRFQDEFTGPYYWMNITLDSEGACGLFNVIDSGKTLNMYGLTLKNGVNSDPGYGGGGICCAANSMVNLYSVSFVDCEGERGGAVYTDSVGTVSISTPEISGTVVGNEKNNYDTNKTIKPSVFEGNTARVGGAVCSMNTLSPNALAIYGENLNAFDQAEYRTLENDPLQYLAEYSVMFIDNSATQYGGAVYTEGTSTVRNASFIGNTITPSGASMSGGAGIWSNKNLTLSNADFIANQSNLSGAGLAVTRIANLSGDLIFAGNTITDRGVSGTNLGAGLYLNTSAVVTASGQNSAVMRVLVKNADGTDALATDTHYSIQFLCNEAPNGGAIFVDYNASLTMDNALIARNRATSGGGLYALGEANVSESLFRQNYASYLGGGAYVQTQSDLSNSEFEFNWSANNGGALYSAVEQAALPTTEGNNYSQNNAQVMPVYDEICIAGSGENPRTDKRQYKIADGWETYVGAVGLSRAYDAAAMVKFDPVALAMSANSIALQFPVETKVPELLKKGKIDTAIELTINDGQKTQVVELPLSQFQYDEQTQTLHINLETVEGLVPGNTYSCQIALNPKQLLDSGSVQTNLESQLSFDWIFCSTLSRIVGTPTVNNVLPQNITNLHEWSRFYVELWSENGLTSSTHTVAYDASLFTLDANGIDVPENVSVQLSEGKYNEETGLTELTVTVSVAVENPGAETVRLVSLRFTPAENGGFASSLDSATDVVEVNGDALESSVASVAYDLDRNGVVNMTDFIEFAKRFNQKSTSGEQILADFDNDGSVAINDFVLFATNYNCAKSDENQRITLPTQSAAMSKSVQTASTAVSTAVSTVASAAASVEIVDSVDAEEVAVVAVTEPSMEPVVAPTIVAAVEERAIWVDNQDQDQDQNNEERESEMESRSLSTAVQNLYESQYQQPTAAVLNPETVDSLFAEMDDDFQNFESEEESEDDFWKSAIEL